MFGFRKSKSTSDTTQNYDGYQQQNYDIKLANLESKYESMKEDKEYFEKEYKKLKGLVESLCKSIVSNQYSISQLGGNSILQDLNIYKLIDFTKIDYQKQKIDNLETLKKLNDQIKMQGVMIESLKQQLSQHVGTKQRHFDIRSGRCHRYRQCGHTGTRCSESSEGGAEYIGASKKINLRFNFCPAYTIPPVFPYIPCGEFCEKPITKATEKNCSSTRNKSYLDHRKCGRIYVCHDRHHVGYFRGDGNGGLCEIQ